MSKVKPAAKAAQPPYTHFILTRFNVKNFYHCEEPTDEWLKGRLDLFRTYCLPSFERQTNKNFRWLVFVDSESPEWFLSEIFGLSAGSFEVVPVAGAFNKSFVAAAVATRLTSPFLITTRVDNDDAIATDFVEAVQACFDFQDFEFINLVNGIQFSSNRAYLRPYTKNPFLSLVEHVESRAPSTVYVEHHYRVQEKGPIRNVRTSHPMWLQVIHGGNVLNEIVGLRVPGSLVAPYFGVSLSFKDDVLDLSRGFLISLARIVLRLVRRPARLLEVIRVLGAKGHGPVEGSS